MLWTICILFFSLWLLGVLTPSTLDGHIHILLFVVLVTLFVRFFGKTNAID
jgi:hypothetical protein